MAKYGGEESNELCKESGRMTKYGDGEERVKWEMKRVETQGYEMN